MASNFDNKLFISYSSGNSEEAFKLSYFLKNKGYHVSKIQIKPKIRIKMRLSASKTVNFSYVALQESMLSQKDASKSLI
jgi:hypothetical protein